MFTMREGQRSVLPTGHATIGISRLSDKIVAVAAALAATLVGGCGSGSLGSSPAGAAGAAGWGTGMGGAGPGLAGTSGGTGGVVGISGSTGTIGVAGTIGAAGTFGCGGGSGGGSTLGMGGGAATEPRIAASDCTSQLGTPAGPILFDANVRCTSAGYPISVAIAADDRGYVGFGGPLGASTRLVSFAAPGQVSFEVGPTVRDAQLSVDHAGTPHFVGNGFKSGVLFYRGDAGVWSRQHISLPSIAESGDAFVPARFASDGRAFIAFHSIGACGALVDLLLATRDVSGAWSDQPLSFGKRWWEVLVVDSRQRPHVVALDNASSTTVVSDWSPQAGATPLFTPTPYAAEYPLAVPFGDGRVAAGVLTEAGIHVLVPDAAGVVRDRLLPGTQVLKVTGCPPITARGSMVLPPTPCTEGGDGARGPVGLAASGDSAVLVAYMAQHVDRDVLQECHVGQLGSIDCSWPTTADRSVTELVVARVPIDGSAPSVGLRVPVGGEYRDYSGMDVKGSRLAIAFTWRRAPPDDSQVRVLLLDTTTL